MRSVTRLFTAENVLSYALAFVVAWFGYHEVVSPADWVGFVPPFLGAGALAMNLVLLHGVLLVGSGVALIADVWRRWVAVLVALMIANIAGTLIWTGGLGSVAVRDIGLCGAAAALAISAWKRRGTVDNES